MKKVRGLLKWCDREKATGKFTVNAGEELSLRWRD